MMKKYFLLAGIFASTLAIAQKGGDPKLTKGQQITVTVTSAQEMDLGMGMTMTTNSTSENKLNVTDVKDQEYKVSSVLSKMKLTGSMMGKETSFDSEKDDATQQEIAKELRPLVGKSTNVTLNRKTGEAVSDVKKPADAEPGDDPMGMMAGALTDNDANLVSGAFMTTLAGKKPGDKWMDSSIVKGMKTINNYTLESIAGDVATINIAGTITGTETREAMGSSMDVAMNTKTSGKITVNTKTLMVQKKSIVADITSTVDVMGQTMEITGKTTTDMEYK